MRSELSKLIRIYKSKINLLKSFNPNTVLKVTGWIPPTFDKKVHVEELKVKEIVPMWEQCLEELRDKFDDEDFEDYNF